MHITTGAAVKQLQAEGYRSEDIHGAIDSLIGAGLDLSIADQPDDDWLLTGDDMDVLRDQLNS